MRGFVDVVLTVRIRVILLRNGTVSIAVHELKLLSVGLRNSWKGGVRVSITRLFCFFICKAWTLAENLLFENEGSAAFGVFQGFIGFTLLKKIVYSSEFVYEESPAVYGSYLSNDTTDGIEQASALMDRSVLTRRSGLEAIKQSNK